MASVRLDGASIRDWSSFHEQSRMKFGFPDFYGRNMDAWIDCLSTLRDDDGMSAFSLAAQEMLQIELIDSAILQRQAPQILNAVRDCIDAINERYVENDEKPALELLLR